MRYGNGRNTKNQTRNRKLAAPLTTVGLPLSTIPKKRSSNPHSRSLRYGTETLKKIRNSNVLVLPKAARIQSEQVLAAPLTTVGLPLSTSPEERISNINKVWALLEAARRQSEQVLAARLTDGLPLSTIPEEEEERNYNLRSSSNLSTNPEENSSKRSSSSSRRRRRQQLSQHL